MNKKVKIGILVSMFFFSFKNIDTNKLNGSWYISSSGILLTSFIKEKDDFYKACKNKKVKIQKSILTFQYPDNCLDIKKRIIINRHFFCKRKDLPVNNEVRLFASIGYKTDSISMDKKIEVFTGDINIKEQIVIIVLNKNHLIIYSDPAYILLKRSNVSN